MTAFEYVMVGLVVVLVILPPLWDPAVRLKEWVKGFYDLAP